LRAARAHAVVALREAKAALCERALRDLFGWSLGVTDARGARCSRSASTGARRRRSCGRPARRPRAEEDEIVGGKLLILSCNAPTLLGSRLPF
jgi:hypothetical protein